MTSEEFWEQAKAHWDAWNNGDNASVDFFISDISAVMEEWESEEHEYSL